MTPEENIAVLKEVEAKLDAMKQAKAATPEDMKLITGKLDAAMVLMPFVFEDPSLAEKLAEETRRTGKPAPVPKDTKTKPMLINNKDGQCFMGIYTSPGQIPSHVNKNGIMNIPFKQVLAIAADPSKGLEGIVINPFSHNVILKASRVPVDPKTGVATGSVGATGATTGSVAMADTTGAGAAHGAGVAGASLGAGATGASQGMSPEKIAFLSRQNVEYVLLPRSIYSEGKDYFDALNEQVLYSLFAGQFLGAVKNPYATSDFNVMSLGVSETLDLVSIEMPAKGRTEGLCRQIYVTWDKDKNRAGYYMIVKRDTGDKLIFVESDGRLKDLGDAPIESNEMGTIIEEEAKRA